MGIWDMKTTLELPDSVFRKAKVFAASEGKTMKQFFTEALEAKLAKPAADKSDVATPPWMAGFGELSDLHDETMRIQGLIEEEFEKIEPEDIS